VAGASRSSATSRSQRNLGTEALGRELHEGGCVAAEAKCDACGDAEKGANGSAAVRGIEEVYRGPQLMKEVAEHCLQMELQI